MWVREAREKCQKREKNGERVGLKNWYKLFLEFRVNVLGVWKYINFCLVYLAPESYAGFVTISRSFHT